MKGEIMKKRLLIFALILLAVFSFTAMAMDQNQSDSLEKSPSILENETSLNTPDKTGCSGLDNDAKTTNGDQKPNLAKRGCCSNHNGVCGCDEKTGRVRCCDGTISPSCKCVGN